ncbi:LLM class flavin-dependent oxidoreductase [Streptomyces mirabilis]|uniref:LLM class flavin-dependent oxidoreductase n=1 Tax=Streptomyces mirabilis TaxID=68239 RepID=UPI00332BFBFD
MSAATTHDTLALSVLDIVPVTRGQASRDAIAASMAQAELADRLGYRRFWFAEHHNTESVAATNPAVLIGIAAARTSRIRIGSGGVMLPNYAPFSVAEQFATLEAAAPGRIDLGLGRSSGSDPVSAYLLGTNRHVAGEFADHVSTLSALLDPAGAQVRLANGGSHDVRVTPLATGRPDIWMLGSSPGSASLAAQLGIPYVYAHHFFERGTLDALDRYRAEFQPSAALDAPLAIVTANVVVAETEEEARMAALPNLLQLARIETGRPLPMFETVEHAAAIAPTVAEADHLEAIRRRWFIGRAEDVEDRLMSFAADLGVTEIMVAPSSGWRETDDRTRVSSRETTLRQLADRMLTG